MDNKYEVYNNWAIMLLLTAIVSPITIVILLNSVDFEKLGQIGDLLGGSTAPFINIAALLMIIATYRTQREELSQTLVEFKEQSKTFAIQRFENTFFQLISLHHQITNRINTRNNMKEVTGRSCFEVFKKRFSAKLYTNNYKKETEIGDLNKRYSKLIIAYDKFYNENQDQLGHYFRNLYHIVKFINKSELSKESKRSYVGIVRAQLSTFEMVFLFYNAIGRHGNEKFKPLIDEYDLLQNFDYSVLINENHKEIYDQLDSVKFINCPEDDVNSSEGY